MVMIDLRSQVNDVLVHVATKNEKYFVVYIRSIEKTKSSLG